MTDLRYPIGEHVPVDALDPAARRAAIDAIDDCPDELRRATIGLDDARLDTPYRPEGWTVRQVVHHLPDSHLNAYVRHKLAVTENEPTIKPYDETKWAELADAKTANIAVSLTLLAAVTERWVRFLRSLPDEAFTRRFVHPEANRVYTLDGSVAMYAWHSRHHVAQIDALRRREGW